ncbi:MAG: response regulator [Bauldia sp.]
MMTTLHFLVVDDSSVIRKVVRRICEDLDFTVSEAEDGEVALALCRRTMPDAVMVDATIPAMDGIDFVKALRRIQGGERPKILFCMTEYNPAIVGRAVRAGADDYLLKPFDRSVIEAKLQEVGLL